MKPCCLGDVLLTTPLLAAVRQQYPAAEITYAVGPWSRPMVATSAHLDRIITIPERWTPGSWLSVARLLHNQKFDLALVPDRSPVLGTLVARAAIPVRVGLDSAGRGFGYTHPVPIPAGIIHEADLYSLLAARLGIDSIPRRLFFTTTPAAEQQAHKLLTELQLPGPLIVLHPGGGANPGMVLARKRWLPERWAAVADWLQRTQGATVLLIGGPSDREAVAAVRAAMRSSAPVLVQPWDLTVLAALLRHARLFLGHDTGMMHLACAMETPTLAIFGPSDPQMYGPYAPHGHYLWQPTSSSPCFVNGTADQHCPCNHACMDSVTTSLATHQIEKLLQN